MTLDELSHTWMEGAGRMLPLAIILVLALALGSVSKALGTGQYVAGLVGDAGVLLDQLFRGLAGVGIVVGLATYGYRVPDSGGG